MKGDYTLTMIKPDAMQQGNMGRIIDAFIRGGFRIAAMKMVRLDQRRAEKFYEVHRERPFYADLVRFMSSGPITAAILKKENAVEAFRELIGATDPSKAAEGTLRNLYGSSIQFNAVHGSDSDENAALEASFFFSQLERVD